MSDNLSAGFAEPVADAQACFRAVLDAMARPGQVHPMPGVAAPAPLDDAAAAMLLTLVDQETPLWLDPNAHAACGWIAFHTGAPITRTLARALFVLTLALPDLAGLSAGTDEAPETAATVILQVASLSAGAQLRLSGPGLREPAVLTVDGLPHDFAAIWAANQALFPRGIDLILCAGRQLAALPRSVTVKDA
ncbi:phosphonate C-P lyase system protein PhnH [Rhodopila sp.]|uniref:phosphonate C-P lyase system protein PhnH n=1 Tax=Rhodopila sp. TaxID=2480087 RepID=UPI003D0A99E8